jgi:hypothetical protein
MMAVKTRIPIHKDLGSSFSDFWSRVIGLKVGPNTKIAATSLTRLGYGQAGCGRDLAGSSRLR